MYIRKVEKEAFILVETMILTAVCILVLSMYVKSIIWDIEKSSLYSMNEDLLYMDEAELKFIDDIEEEINAVLSDIGYRISPTPNSCPTRNGVEAVTKSMTANYEYCIYAYSTTKGPYYGVTAYMYYEIPVIGAKLRFPVYGETKINGILG